MFGSADSSETVGWETVTRDLDSAVYGHMYEKAFGFLSTGDIASDFHAMILTGDLQS